MRVGWTGEEARRRGRPLLPGRTLRPDRPRHL